MSTIATIATAKEPITFEADTNTPEGDVWFKTGELPLKFCHRVVQIQLSTVSHDQGNVDEPEKGSWSWFEVAIFANKDATTPRVKDDKLLSFHSHHNRLGDASESLQNFGIIFDRRGELLDALEENNVIGVRACAQFPGWKNIGISGKLRARVMSEDIFSPQSWTLQSADVPIELERNVKNGVYTICSTTDSHVVSESNVLAEQLWLATPELSKHVITHIEEVQLFTHSKHQVGVSFPEAGSWSWFDVMILETAESTTPKVKDGRSMVWMSHVNNIGDTEYTHRNGILFNRDHEMLSSLEVGNVIAVRTCAKFAGWENHALSARFVIHISNKGPHEPREIAPNVVKVQERMQKLEEQINRFYMSVESVHGLPTYESATSGLLSSPIRADQDLGFGRRPLRLLSLDGGGVRGVSIVAILRNIMLQLAPGVLNPRPCEYFDMMGGTSTGGLLAILLGRLRMTLDDADKAYVKLSTALFERNALVKGGALTFNGAKYDASVAEKEFKRIVEEFSAEKNANAKMFDTYSIGVDGKDKDDACKVFVMSVLADEVNKNSGVHLRTYVNPREPGEYGDCEIWEAARATSAAPSFFAPMLLKGPDGNMHKFVDGGLGFNNPCAEVLKEAIMTFGKGLEIGCFISIGTGIPKAIELGTPNLVGAVKFATTGLVGVATSCERAHHTFEPIINLLPLNAFDKYSRFNVGTKIAQTGWLEKIEPAFYEKWIGRKDKFVERSWEDSIIEMDDYKGLKLFADITGYYMDGEKQKVDACVQRMKGVMDWKAKQ